MLKAELRLTPARRAAAARAFVALLVVSLLSVALRPPPFVAISVAMVLSFAPRMLDPAAATRAALRLVGETAAATALGILTLSLWADQPWFLLPWASAVIALLLFHSRVSGGSSFPALFYVISVFYHPMEARHDLYTALAAIPIALLGGGVMLLTHVALWPKNPEAALHRLLSDRLADIRHVLERLYQRVGSEVDVPDAPVPRDYPVPGVLSDQLQALASAEAAEPGLRSRHQQYLDLIVELDTGFNVATWVAREIREESPGWWLDARNGARLRAVADECHALHRCFDMADTACGGFSRTSTDPHRIRGIDLGLHQLEECAERMRHAVHALLAPPPTETVSPPMPDQPSETPPWPGWLTQRFWLENRVPLQFGLKYAFGAVICLLLIQAFNWPGIDTAIFTCLVVAQGSLGADYRKSLLRIAGASCGGMLAWFFIIVLQPALVTVAGFLVAIAPPLAIAAWVASASPRIFYVGYQMGYSFAAVILHGDGGPVTDLALARDRILGILLGITVMGILDYLLWPQRADRQIFGPLTAALSHLGEFALTVSRTTTGTLAGARLMYLLYTIDQALRRALELLDQARSEPGADRPEGEAQRAGISLVVSDLHRIARILQTRLCYCLGAEFEAMPKRVLRQQQVFDRALSRRLFTLARNLRSLPPKSARNAWQEREHRVDRMMRETDAALPVSALLGLDRILWATVDRLYAHAAGLSGNPEASFTSSEPTGHDPKPA